METLFSFLVLFAQVCAVFTVAAFIADHIIEPIIRRKHGRRY